MSLYLPDQRLGAHSQSGSSSHKFMLKGRQAGGMHRGHSWVFRAESFDTMLAWYEDLKTLTEKSTEEINRLIKSHSRNTSAMSARSVSSLEEDEADDVPYASSTILADRDPPKDSQSRPEPGGKFPSDVQLHKTNAPASPSSSGSEPQHDLTTLGGHIHQRTEPRPERDPVQPRDMPLEPLPHTGLGVESAPRSNQPSSEEDGDRIKQTATIVSTSGQAVLSDAKPHASGSEAYPAGANAANGARVKSKFTEMLVDDQ